MTSKANLPAERQRSTFRSTPENCGNQPRMAAIGPLSVRETQLAPHVHQIGTRPGAANGSAMRPRWLTVNRMAEEYKDVITEAALRHLIWNAEAYARHPDQGRTSNGFLPVIVRPPFQRKILLDRFKFEEWLTSRGTYEQP